MRKRCDLPPILHTVWVALVAGNRVEFVEALLGAVRAGMLVTPVKTSCTAAEIEYVLRSELWDGHRSNFAAPSR